jgi:hypothetical protein
MRIVSGKAIYLSSGGTTSFTVIDDGALQVRATILTIEELTALIEELEKHKQAWKEQKDE